MSKESLEKLARNIEREQCYPPLVVRPHPVITGEYEILDGHQRATVAKRLGHPDAVCFVWHCDDATALILLGSLNRLRGEDAPELRFGLLSELSALLPAELLAELLPDDASAIERSLAVVERPTDVLLDELTDKIERARERGPKLFTFSVSPEAAPEVEAAIGLAMSKLEGSKRRGRALAFICVAFTKSEAP